LLGALASLVRAVTADILGQEVTTAVERAVEEVHVRREPCAQAASKRARGALAPEDMTAVDRPALEWMSYAALLVQTDRIVEDLRAPLPP
jgi:hypothetical protein